MGVIQRISSLVHVQMRHAYPKQEHADEARSSLPAFNTSALDLPSDAIPVSGEAATPHMRLTPLWRGLLHSPHHHSPHHVRVRPQWRRHLRATRLALVTGGDHMPAHSPEELDRLFSPAYNAGDLEAFVAL